MAENTFALLTHLSSNESSLPKLQSYTPPTTAYFSLLSRYFFSYTFTTAQRLYTGTLLISLPLLSPSRLQAQSVIGISLSLLSGALSANLVALGMKLSGHGMKWFAGERLCLILYTPAALLGVLLCQLFLSSRAPGVRMERLTLRSMHMFFAGTAWVVQMLGVGSAGLLWFASLFTGGIVLADMAWGGKGEVPLGAYLVGSVGPLLLGTEVTASLTDIFVPLASLFYLFVRNRAHRLCVTDRSHGICECDKHMHLFWANLSVASSCRKHYCISDNVRDVLHVPLRPPVGSSFRLANPAHDDTRGCCVVAPDLFGILHTNA